MLKCLGAIDQHSMSNLPGRLTIMENHCGLTLGYQV